ncbi:bifunctional phosphopantothenoylcysteine decarboxylase/phosphopantothenate--cysteine ligase CoaBC [Chlorobaculum sp. MV4-Y]|uniref:bifunctional phosphopantothenoylcysteine decarboxylase/phosphopantothenate--cysteine ligase CoaBC n=1 Tax=Chlorobaculum sp. MV4-Y TaxID=2976335 RepID=UPI0021AFAE56|nr:bifunctional phosphopantothenoylcysteine decarboxylase/phosphopantothenate--cysteine ligase CoaBC [Chlorobaculum sp. MV4-Y]UWX57846.1 bifunctional phosphopantothenoylcysteine decarboxylase/phosphopantothenate--cysteine ligase CoaBC [Chlorobaculum sp. MV4-Y]
MLTGRNILLGISGGIAAYKTPQLVRLLKKSGADVQVLATTSALKFVSELSLATVSNRPVLTGIFTADTEGEYTRHISLGEWADAFVIAPATANTLARLATGLCDDMLSLCFLTLRPDKPVLIAPAMDGHMYNSLSVQRNLSTLAEEGCRILEPESGSLASGQCGLGRMPEPETIFEALAGMLATPEKSALNGKTVVVTAGPTREKIDGVRFLSNYSSGKMGFAIAADAARRGAVVRLVTGPVNLPTPPGVERIDVESAEQMLAAARPLFDDCDLFIGAAAVADYRPEASVEGKIKKKDAEMEIRLVRNPDILAEFATNRKPGQLAVGFALETAGGIDYARKKLTDKQLDLIAFNIYNGHTSGFEVDTNVLTLLGRDGSVTELPLLSKEKAAAKLLDAVETILPR